MSMVVLTLRADGFDKFRCDRNLSLSMRLAGMVKILKCADEEDALTMIAHDRADTVTFMLDSPNREKVINIKWCWHFIFALCPFFEKKKYCGIFIACH